MVERRVAPRCGPAPTPASCRGAGRTRSCSRSRRGTAARPWRSTSAASSAFAFAIDACTVRRGRQRRSTRGAVHERAGELERDARVRRGGASRPGTSRSARRTACAPSRSRRSSRACVPRTRTAGRRFRTTPRSNAASCARRVHLGAGVPRTSNRRRAPSTDGRGMSSTSARSYRPAAVTITSTVSAHGTRARAGGRRVRSARPRSGTPHAAVSTIGSGTREPARLLEDEHEVDHRRARARPSPPGASMPTTPMSASCSHRPGTRPVLVRPRVAQRARACTPCRGGRGPRRGTRAGRRRRRSARAQLPRQAEHALGDHVALDLVRARVDRARERELVALHPGRVVAVEQLGVRAEQVERELVQSHVELRPEHLHHARLRARCARPRRCA